jgi:hypothetical protein
MGSDHRHYSCRALPSLRYLPLGTEGDQRYAKELEYLDELAWEHQQEIADNRNKIERLIRSIQRNQTPSAAFTAHLDGVSLASRCLPAPMMPSLYNFSGERRRRVLRRERSGYRWVSE